MPIDSLTEFRIKSLEIAVAHLVRLLVPEIEGKIDVDDPGAVQRLVKLLSEVKSDD